jgi:geranylgeranyl diphosphate synthase type II
MDIKEFMRAKAARTEAALEDYLNTWNGVPPVLLEATRFSLFAGGKRLRPALALAAAEVISGDDAVALPAACALEMIHTYSLVHDDLPAMDDDDLRRGQPTCHKKYGEATAILAGDTLQTMAFDILAQANSARAVGELARAAGASGMVGGQQFDLSAENRQLSLDELRNVHACKTGALIRVSLRLGAILAGASDDDLEALSRYGEEIGLAFQITDDILDVVGDEAAIGKPVGSDEAKHKSTYPALVGLDQARTLADEAIARALTALDRFDERADPLRALAQYILDRQN